MARIKDIQPFEEDLPKIEDLKVINPISNTTNGTAEVVDGVLQSPQYTPGVRGWRLNSDGSAEFQEITARISDLNRTFLTSEDITTGDAVAIGTGGTFTGTSSTSSGSTESIDLTHWASQSFTTTSKTKYISGVVIRGGSDGVHSVTLTASIRANSGGAPTGSDLVSGTSSSFSAASAADYTINFSSPLAVSPSTTYHICVRDNNNVWPTPYAYITRANSAGQGNNTSSNSGSSWSSSNGAWYYSTKEIDTTSGSICKASAGTNTTRGGYIGVAQETVSSGDVCSVVVSGVDTTQSGLTSGSLYYVSNTNGTISTSPGTNSIVAGRALSATELKV